ncbi:MAG TPA: patatin-like phospholipase family protein [Marmoricola sp.]|jgi:NTE family protein|nr:patatin-like phospholipase family protein [Marmoricola sp.]
MTIAFVLSGGCSLGAVQVGMLQALSARGVRPDLLVGTSAGALNAAYVAGHGAGAGALADLAGVWRGLTRRTLFPVRPGDAFRMVTGGTNALCPDIGLRRVVRRHLAFERLEDAPIPLHVVATDFLSGREVLLSRGDAESAVLASCAVPGIFPSVHRDGRHLVDGGLADNTAISQAVALGADRVYVLPSGYSCALTMPPRTPLGAAAHAITLLTQQRLVADVDRFTGEVDLVVLPPPCPMRVAAIDFNHAAELVQRGRESAASCLSRDGGRRSRPAEEVALHPHDAPATPEATPA